MQTPLLAAALIVKNEEAYLPACLAALNALRPLLAEVCVYDTGSTDSTVDIARRAGATVQLGYWDHDFARAKNEAVAMTTAKWVLVVDADEVVHADVTQLGIQLREALTVKMTGMDVLQVRVNDVRSSGRLEQSWFSRRLLRPGRAHHVNPVHEDVVSLRQGQELTEAQIPPSVVYLDHLGYTDDETVQRKTARNLAIADAAVAQLDGMVGKHDELIRALVDRARSARAQGRDDIALADLRRVQRMTSTRTYRTWGLELLVDLLIDHGEDAEARLVIDQLHREGVAEPAFCDWLIARLDLTMGRVVQGMERLRTIDVLKSSGGVVVAPYLLLDARYKGALELGEHDEAAVCLIRLMASFGRFGERCAEMLLTLWGKLPREVLVDMLIEADRGHLARVIEEFDTFDAGHEIAGLLRARAAQTTPTRA